MQTEDPLSKFAERSALRSRRRAMVALLFVLTVLVALPLYPELWTGAKSIVRLMATPLRTIEISAGIGVAGVLLVLMGRRLANRTHNVEKHEVRELEQPELQQAEEMRMILPRLLMSLGGKLRVCGCFGVPLAAFWAIFRIGRWACLLATPCIAIVVFMIQLRINYVLLNTSRPVTKLFYLYFLGVLGLVEAFFWAIFHIAWWACLPVLGILILVSYSGPSALHKILTEPLLNLGTGLPKPFSPSSRLRPW